MNKSTNYGKRSGGVAIFHRIGTPSGKTGFLNNTLIDTKNHRIYTFLGFIQSDQADIQKSASHHKAMLPPDLLLARSLHQLINSICKFS